MASQAEHQGTWRRAARRLLRAAPILVTVLSLLWVAATNPLAQPFVERSTTDLALVLERQVARVATPEWIADRLSQAVAEGDAEAAQLYLDLADDLGHVVDPEDAKALIAQDEGLLAGASACGRCMIDITACDRVAQIATCAAPFELSPLGDVNALRRAALAWTGGEGVDTLDASLALVGLGATVAVVASGGTSVTVKAGSGLMRMAYRMGTLKPGALRTLRVPIRWGALPGYLTGAAKLDDVTDTARLARAGAFATDLDRVRRATSTGEALRLMRLVDGPEDAARLARVAEASGPRTTRTLAVLGKSNAFRATLRLSRGALGLLVLAWLTFVQIGVVLATRLGALCLRQLAR